MEGKVNQGVGDRPIDLDCYYRFNVEHGLGDVPMDNCDAQTFMDMDRFVNQEYPQQDSNVNLNLLSLDQLAQKLVQNRRKRARPANNGRPGACWERFAKCNHFNCNVNRCTFNRGRQGHMTRQICQGIRQGEVHDVRSHTNREERRAHAHPDINNNCGPFSSNRRGPW